MSDLKSEQQIKSTANKFETRKKNDGIPVSTEHDKRYNLEASDEFIENRRIRGEAKRI